MTSFGSAFIPASGSPLGHFQRGILVIWDTHPRLNKDHMHSSGVTEQTVAPYWLAVLLPGTLVTLESLKVCAVALDSSRDTLFPFLSVNCCRCEENAPHTLQI